VGGDRRQRTLEVVVNVVATVIAMGFFVFGMWLMGTAPELASFQAAVFFGGILCVAAALAIPTTLLGRSDS
jgi:3-dehydroquinate synthetase